MPLTRTDKAQLIEDYENGLAVSPHAFVLGFQGIKVPQVTALREKIRQSGGSYAVVKNTLALRAVTGQALDALKDHFTGPTAVVYGGDPVALAKVLTEFAKDVPAIQFKAALVESRPLEGAQVKDIAQLPSREELIGKLLFLMQSPVSRFVRVLAAVPQQLVIALDQISKQRDTTSAPAEAAPSEGAE